MGTHAANNAYWDYETRDLKQLLDAFGSTTSLEDISSAYIQGGHNLEAAVEILLCNLQGSTSGSSSLSFKDDDHRRMLEVTNDFTEKASVSETHTIVANQKKGSASMGTVVGVIGKDYVMPKPSKIETVERTKPPKVNVEEFTVYETTPPAAETMIKETEEFLFKMLGDGFQLDKKDIQEVLGHCGYDVETTMDKLLDMSAKTLEKSGDAFNLTTEERPQIPTDACKESAGRLVSGHKSSESNKDRGVLEKELLGSLFSVPQWIDEAPRRTGPAKAYKKPRPFGKIVSEPLRDTPVEFKTPVSTLLVPYEGTEEEEEDAYQVTRKSVKEYWTTMKEYYKSAVDAYTKGDRMLANKFTEEGHFFKEKAREADEKSSQIYLESRDEGMAIDVHEYSPKEAIRLLRVYLTTLSGIEAFPCFKIIVVGDTVGTKDAARKRLVQKFLEKESIKWIEERDGRTMVIRLDQIDRKGLSFAHK